MKKLSLTLLSFLCCMLLQACAQPQPLPANPPTVSDPAPAPTALDLSTYFADFSGCAVLYDESQDRTTTHNEPLTTTRQSPYSSFKIIAALAGLQQGVLQDDTSLMYYTGATYAIDSWNDNLTLKQAFKSSCVWYFKQVVEQVGQPAMQTLLDSLSYGNCDTSQWAGSGLNPTQDINGFWLGSSLLISPAEQVAVLRQIFGDNSPIDPAHVELLKSIMQVDTVNGYTVYGKTGTGNEQGWFVGLAQSAENTLYFAVFLDDQSQAGSGAAAKQIALDIVAEHTKP